MAFGILSIVLSLAVIYFAAIGVQATVTKYREFRAIELVRDFLKYALLFTSVLLTCLGLSGLLGLWLDIDNVDYYGKLDAARWSAFLVVGIPVIAVIVRWIRRDFRRDLQASESPAWQIYLFAAATSSLVIWFVPLNVTLRWFAGEAYRPRELAQAIVAFAVWIVHVFLIRKHSSVISNMHRFAGLASGITASAVGSIGAIGYGISKWMNVATGKYELQNNLILLIIGAPVALYYWSNLDYHGSTLEVRIYRTFAGKVIPTVFAAFAATFALGSTLNWYFGEHINDAPRYFTHVPQQIATVIVLVPLVLYFRYLVSEFSEHGRDDITRIFQYLVSGAALIGASVAGGWFIAGLLEFNSFVNTSISGFSGLMVALPIWRFEWRHCEHAIHYEFESEHNSPIRRFFLYLMIAAPTIASFASAVSLSYIFFKGLFVGGFEWIDIKAAFGALVSAALVAIYQYRVFKSEQDGVTKRKMTLAVR